jgi:hypothetical protein
MQDNQDKKYNHQHKQNKTRQQDKKYSHQHKQNNARQPQSQDRLSIYVKFDKVSID